MSETVCGPLLYELAAEAGHAEVAVAELFRYGSGLFDEEGGVDAGRCAESNAELLSILREDEHAAQLHQLTLDDAALGRMSPPVAARNIDRVGCVPQSFVTSACVLPFHPSLAGQNGPPLRCGAGRKGRWFP